MVFLIYINDLVCSRALDTGSRRNRGTRPFLAILAK